MLSDTKNHHCQRFRLAKGSSSTEATSLSNIGCWLSVFDIRKNSYSKKVPKQETWLVEVKSKEEWN